MIDRKKQERINTIFREMDIHPDQKKFLNCVKFHPRESMAHRRAKFELACEDYDAGIPYIQECWTLDRKRRFDHLRFVDDEDDRVVEIETNPKVEKKDADKTIRIKK